MAESKILPLAALVAVSVTSRAVLVTPQMARDWLATQVTNRKVSQERVQAYARRMKAGRWRLIHQGIGFDREGHLIDGQHRLQAIILADLPVLLMVAEGMEAESQNVMDDTRVRSACDQLTFHGEPRAKNKLARARVLLGIESGFGSARVSGYDESKDLLEKHKDALEWASNAFSGSKTLHGAPIAGAFAYAWMADRQADVWAKLWLSGAGLDERDPILVLRNAFLRVGHLEIKGSAGRVSWTMKTLRALWGKRRGESLSKIYDSADGAIGFGRLMGKDTTVWNGWLTNGREGGSKESSNV